LLFGHGQKCFARLANICKVANRTWTQDCGLGGRDSRHPAEPNDWAGRDPHPPQKVLVFYPCENIIFINARLDFALACEDDEDNDDGVVIWGENVFYICQINAADDEKKQQKIGKGEKNPKERKVLGAKFSVRYSAFSYGFPPGFSVGRRRRKRKSCV